MSGMSYEDARDWMRSEADPDYIPPTRAYTAQEWDEGCESHGEDVMLEVMERDMARHEAQVAQRDKARILYLQALLEENNIDYEGR